MAEWSKKEINLHCLTLSECPTLSEAITFSYGLHRTPPALAFTHTAAVYVVLKIFGAL